MLCSADQYTEKYMEDNGEVFPEASFGNVIQKIRAGASKFDSMNAYVVHLLRILDKNDDKFIDYQEFC